MGTLSKDRINSMYETLDSLREICEHRNVELKDMITLYQACEINRGIRALDDLVTIIDDLALGHLFDKDTVGDEK